MSILLTIAAAFLTTVTLMPVVIRLFRSLNLLDIPDKRKIHSVSTPSLGGIAIFAGIVFSLILSTSIIELGTQKFFLGATFLIFLLGVRDDVSSLLAKHKLVIQIFAAVLVVYFGGWRIEGLNGMFGVESFPYGLNELFTVFVIVVMTNAFNLIDGIDGLAGGIALLISLFFGWYFLGIGAELNALVSISIGGAVLGFLLFNWYPSKVFMGDTGSMMLGFMIMSMVVQFLMVPVGTSIVLGVDSPVSIAIALLILPVYDTLRVFFIRFYQGKSPLAPDRNHIHHVLLKLGLNHGQAAILLITYNIVAVVVTVSLQNLGDAVLISSIFACTAIIGAVLDYKVMKKEAARTASLIASNIKLTKSA